MSDLVRVESRVKSLGIRPGDRFNVSEEEAQRLVANGHVRRVSPEPVEEPSAPEKKAAKK